MVLTESRTSQILRIIRKRGYEERENQQRKGV